ncbi:SLC13 family permease [Luteolibacter pohnpeiensis]|uniref:SLC13 family permease n=1 Tax=Luteolibacter pohnpeiensis TaxID=454153 RepID=A0A934S6H8_9BACT|nr:SLC13 family permease [Luteolibacter pohnpeiensis]MBK1881686.1 SLC13 family permease [Luteolibacter pohnpeiensis]
MTLPIALTLLVILLTLIAFIREWATPDVLAVSILCLTVALGLVPMGEMASVFSNEAPLTIAALFIIGGALEQSGAVDHIGRILKSRLSGNLRIAIFSFAVLSAFFSAWMNNTAIVAILLPVTLGFARSKDIPASKLLMPLSYASILGGCCTLIGSSTNLLVNGTLQNMGEKPMGMFELAPIGVPVAIAGIGYLVIFGPKLMPSRSSITGSLEIDHRTSPLYHLLITGDSELVGKKFFETLLADRDSGIHVMEVRRKGTRLMIPLSKLVVEENDRFLVALHRRKGGGAKAGELFSQIGAQLLSTVDGIVSELVVRDESSVLGKTLAASDFRQKYNCVVLAVHRGGLNITSRIAEVPLESADTLLVITALNNLEALKATRDFVLTDTPDDKLPKPEKPAGSRRHVIYSWAALIGVVLTATLTDFLHPLVPIIPKIPIHYAALVGALCLLWLKVMSPREAYASVDWQVLLMLYGLLGLGMAMQNTGTADFLARGVVSLAEGVVPVSHMPIVMLWLAFLLTVLLTEILSNNATAVMMVPIAVTLAHELGVNPRPFIIAVTVGSSMAFSMPMGYQTHMMVYGPGGYRFTDFLRVGIPLNITCWVIACSIIPMVWPF